MNHASRSSTTPAGRRLYKTENLNYTKNKLLVLLFWLLWGDFAFNFFESVFGRFLPIYLKDLQASNTLIGVMSGSFAGLVNVLFLPSISRWSDNYRSARGRRIPLLYAVTPLTVLALIAVGFAPEIGRWIFDRFVDGLAVPITESGVILGILCVFTVSFHFFNMVLVNAYNWLIRDVVPLEVISRFLAWFSCVGTVSGTLFLWFVFPHLMTSRTEIFFGVGIFYLCAFLLMCHNVKEGKYPPPAPQEDHIGIFKTYIEYFRECLGIRLYRNFFIVYLLVTAALNCAGTFVILFGSETLGVDMVNMGHIFAWTSAVSVIFLYPVGWLCDRFSTLYVVLGSIITLCIGAIFALIFVHSQSSYWVYSVAFSLPCMAWWLAQRSASMIIFPVEKFGQFSGGLNVFGCGALIIGNLLMGAVMDITHSDYRMAFLWTAVISAIAIFPMVLVIRDWKAQGGHGHVEAPISTENEYFVGNEKQEIQ